MHARWIGICGALVVAQVACGARDTLRVDGRDGGAPTTGSSASSTGSGAGGAGGEGGSRPPCPVNAFAGDRTGGVRTAIDATHAYWTTVEGALERGSLATGEVTTLARLDDSTLALAL